MELFLKKFISLTVPEKAEICIFWVNGFLKLLKDRQTIRKRSYYETPVVKRIFKWHAFFQQLHLLSALKRTSIIPYYLGSENQIIESIFLVNLVLIRISDEFNLTVKGRHQIGLTGNIYLS